MTDRLLSSFDVFYMQMSLRCGDCGNMVIISNILVNGQYKCMDFHFTFAYHHKQQCNSRY